MTLFFCYTNLEVITMSMIYPNEFRLDGEFYDLDYIMNNVEQRAKKQLIPRFYNKYVNIRTILGGNKCKKMTLFEVKTKLEDPKNMEKVTNVLNYTASEINLIVFIAENEIPMVK